MESISEDATATTITRSERKKSRSQSQSPSKSGKTLSQKELEAWWPFTRLDPSRMPKPIKQPHGGVDEPAPF